MKSNLFATGWLAVSLALASATPVMAQVMRVGGGLQRGFARPPLLVNVGPFDAASNYGPYSPAQVRHAYGVDLLLAAGATGSGQKIGIVDAYGDPSVQTDLNNFCSYYGIPSTSVTIIYAQGQPRGGNSGWALETALDVEWAHAIAPNATIILSVAKSASISDLLGAVDAAVKAGATVVSMSWGAQEFSGVNTYDSHFKAPGVTYVASSGDSGELGVPFEVEWPASSPFVVGVGGTTLYLDASGNRKSPDGTTPSETAWSGSGGGLSSVYGQPAYQNGWQSLGTRCVPDASYVADPNTGVGVAYGRYLYEVGGTSAGAPQWAALIALANSVRTSGAVGGNADIYSVAGTAPTINSGNFLDITSGNNGSDPDDLAGPGYDLVTGLGSPVAAGLVNALAPQNPDFSVSVTPTSQTVAPGSTASYTVTVASLGGFSDMVAFSASGLPSDASASFDPVSVSGSGSSTLTFASSIGGTYTITITGTSGALTHTATVTLVVATPDFSLSASPASRTVRHGSSTTYTVNVTPSGGFSGTVALDATGLPTGATATFSPASINTSGFSTMTVRTSNRTGRQSYTLTITGTSTSPALTHTATVSLTVN
ncbi:MAG: S53 family peptidase [Verrucomicrobiota bacterium]|jgi:subtilase family serine protease